MQYDALDDQVRRYMLEELASDIAAKRLYESRRMSGAGLLAWPSLLMEAFESHDDLWLAARIAGYIVVTERTARGLRSVPHDAHLTLAEGQFNRFYLRGLCRLRLEPGQSGRIQLYRGKQARAPRRHSEALVGTFRDARELLEDLRLNQFDAAIGLANSGLTGR